MPLDRALNVVYALMCEEFGPTVAPRKVRELLDELFATLSFEYDPEGFMNSPEALEQERQAIAAAGAPARRRDR